MRWERVEWYRALCFGTPVGPWRSDRDQARRDLIERQLGSFDDWGRFYITVPGDIERSAEWVIVADVA